MGSGIVLDDKGNILTNHHVVEEADGIVVTLPDGRFLPATVVGSDPETDIAVVRVDGDGLNAARFGDSTSLRGGQPVLAIGNPMGLPGGPTVTSGVVSSIQRKLQRGDLPEMRVIQTDAAVNPGSSGGPLVDLEGKVVAVTTATMPYAEGIGFAIPINEALAVTQQIIQHGKVRRPWLGLVGQDVDRFTAGEYGLSGTRGVFIVGLSRGGPAESSGVRIGDLLVALDKREVADMPDLIAGLREHTPGQPAELEIDRRGRRLTLEVQLGNRPY